MFHYKEEPQINDKDRFLQAFGNISNSLAKDIPEYFMKKEEESRSNKAIKELTGTDISGLPHDFKKIFLEESLKKQGKQAETEAQDLAEENIYESVKDTFGDRFGDVWKSAPQGGRTELIKFALDATQRGIDLDELLKGINPKKNSKSTQDNQGTQLENPNFTNEQENIDVLEEPQEGLPKVEKVNPKNFDKKLSEYIKNRDKGLLNSDIVKRGNERYSANLKEYQETGTKLRSFTRDKERINILDSLSEKLPKNLGRLNVDKEGNLRFPFLASPEAQRFVKTLNEFSQNAKDTFGSRVTNFDLQQYLKRFPNLMNSEEGRRQIIQQMKVVNDINSVYYKNLKDTYDKAGGVRNIDADVAERFADELSEGQVSKLSEKFKQIGQFSSLPNASEFKGKKIKDKETGEIFVSDGNSWVPQE